ncbi:MAG: DNA repair protein RecO [Bacteroidales bacterium]|nr:DNA repair protein RecO [Bacteroidales bacterium]
MTLTTQGLVLHTTKYGETSVIAKVFTRQRGLCSYILKGVRSQRGRGKQNLLQPLSHLEMTVYDNSKKELQYIKEMHPSAHYNNINGDGVKMALVFFMDEVLYKSLKEGEANVELFDYIVGQLQRIDREDSSLSTIPIDMMIHTATHLGIAPMDNYSANSPLFNLKEGRFLSAPTAINESPNVDYFLDATSSSRFHSCLSCSMSHTPMPTLSSKQRSDTLNNLLEYYHIHFPDFRNFKSHEVLHSVLR